MSITFTPDGMFGTYSKVNHVCDELCLDYLPPGYKECPGDWIEAGVNMSNTNAMTVMQALGMDADYCGSIDASELEARCVAAIAEIDLGWRDDSGIATVESRARGGEGCRVVECGVPAGYYKNRIESLLGVARQAQALGVEVTWC